MTVTTISTNKFEGINLSWIIYFLSSFLIVASAQPDWSILSCLMTSCIGYALFWRAALRLTHRKSLFICATLWFAGIQTVQLSWFASDRYVGPYIYLVLFFIITGLGLQFGLITFLLKKQKEMKYLSLLGLSGGWVLLEWGRLFFLSGYSWNPMGLSLTGTLYGLQCASLGGVFGLSFWVIFTNLLALKMLKRFSWNSFRIWSAAFLLPLIFGWAHMHFHKVKMEQTTTPPLSALLVQTAIYPEKKISLGTGEALPPEMQWERILTLLLPYKDHVLDLIILPETVVPYGTDYPIFYSTYIQGLFHFFFQKGESPFVPHESDLIKRVGNSFCAQTLANTFDAEVIIGLEDSIREAGKPPEAYNAAFLFHPFSELRERYEKRILVPLAEYIPFQWCRKIASRYGIEGSFNLGEEAKIFRAKNIPLGMSICYEETFGHLMRENRIKGASLLVNLTNDVWYPRSRLPMVHFLHGRLRAVELGIPLLRACNTGVTCGVDSLGRIVKKLTPESAKEESQAEALHLSLPLYEYPTLYTLWGNWPILIISFLAFVAMICPRSRSKEVAPLHPYPL